MDLSQYVPVMTAIVTAAGTLIGTLFTVSLNSRNQRRREREQQLKEENDKAAAALKAAQQAAEDHKKRADDQRRRARLWKGEYDYLRAWILAQGLTSNQLRDFPKPPDYR